MNEPRRQVKQVSTDEEASKPTQSVTVSESEIAERAYGLYQARGCEPGSDLDDWLQAEQELRKVAQPAV